MFILRHYTIKIREKTVKIQYSKPNIFIQVVRSEKSAASHLCLKLSAAKQTMKKTKGLVKIIPYLNSFTTEYWVVIGFLQIFDYNFYRNRKVCGR